MEKKQVGSPERKLPQKFALLTLPAKKETEPQTALPAILAASAGATDSGSSDSCASCGPDEHNSNLKPTVGVSPRLKGDASFLNKMNNYRPKSQSPPAQSETEQSGVSARSSSLRSQSQSESSIPQTQTIELADLQKITEHSTAERQNELQKSPGYRCSSAKLMEPTPSVQETKEEQNSGSSATSKVTRSGVRVWPQN